MKAEYDDLAALAEKHGVTLNTVRKEASAVLLSVIAAFLPITF